MVLSQVLFSGGTVGSVPAAPGGVTVTDTWVVITLQRSSGLWAVVYGTHGSGMWLQVPGCNMESFPFLCACDWKDFPFSFWFVCSKTAADLFLYCFPVDEKLSHLYSLPAVPASFVSSFPWFHLVLLSNTVHSQKF